MSGPTLKIVAALSSADASALVIWDLDEDVSLLTSEQARWASARLAEAADAADAMAALAADPANRQLFSAVSAGRA